MKRTAEQALTDELDAALAGVTRALEARAGAQSRLASAEERLSDAVDDLAAAEQRRDRAKAALEALRGVELEPEIPLGRGRPTVPLSDQPEASE